MAKTNEELDADITKVYQHMIKMTEANVKSADAVIVEVAKLQKQIDLLREMNRLQQELINRLLAGNTDPQIKDWLDQLEDKLNQ